MRLRVPLMQAIRLQQYLPFTVLKHTVFRNAFVEFHDVATVLTVYGIETDENALDSYADVTSLQQYLPFTVLKQTQHS